MDDPDAVTEIGRLPLAEEVARILRRRRVSGRVRVAVTTAEEADAVEATLRRRDAVIERVPVGREVSAPPPIRQEGDTVVVPVLEERVEIVRRLVVTEEIRFRIRMEEEPVSLPVRLLRQSVAVERTPVHDNPSHVISGEDTIMQHTLVAMFDSRAEADRAAEALRGLNVQASDVEVHPASGAGAPAMTSEDDDRRNYSSLGRAMLPEEDFATYGEGMRRGGAVVTAKVAEDDMRLAMDAMEAAGAVDVDEREESWRSEGWTGAGTGAGAMLGTSSDGSRTGTSAMLGSGAPDGTRDNPSGTMLSRGVDQVAGTNISGAHPENETRGTGGMAASGQTTGTTGTAGAMTGREEAIPLAEERLRVGKRVAHEGRVRVRSYVVETPVEEQVRLREEHVRVERRPVDRAATGTDAELFRDRVIEAEESREEAIVQKDVRVTGEVVVNKEATERTETIHDTVRRTEVDVDEDAVANDPVRRPGKGAA